MSYFRNKRLMGLLGLIALSLVTWFVTVQLNIDWLRVIKDLPNAITFFINDYFPVDFSKVDVQLLAIGETIMIAVSGTTTGMIIGFFLALMISMKTTPHPTMRMISRTLASILRNIPEGVWAIMLLVSFWSGNFLAYIVMSIVSTGFLARVFSDSIDETNASAIEALQATGASYWQIVRHAVIPETMPSLLSWSLYSIENNIRSSTIVGMLAGGGIGFYLDIYKGYMDYQTMSSAIILIAILVLVTDNVTSRIRNKILS